MHLYILICDNFNCLVCFLFSSSPFQISIGSLVLIVRSTPVKVSRPQAITAKNLTQEQIETLIQENPPRPSILQPSDQFLPPSIPFYLPDPDRNKSRDDYHLLAAYPHDGKPNENPTKVVISLDTYARPPPIPDFQDTLIAEQLQQAENDKTSYSYNNRFDYYFPVRVVYDSNEKYADRELQLMEMQPPNQNDEPNYYDVKPKKLPKKYQPNKKDVNHSKSNGFDDELIPIDNDGLVLADEQSSSVTSQPVERFAPAPSFHRLTDDDLNTGEYIPKQRQKQHTKAISQTSDDDATSASSSDTFERHHSGHSGEANSEDNDYDVHDSSGIVGDDDKKSETDTEAERVEFQLHGFKGPNSYRFGYDTGFG